MERRSRNTLIINIIITKLAQGLQTEFGVSGISVSGPGWVKVHQRSPGNHPSGLVVKRPPVEREMQVWTLAFPGSSCTGTPVTALPGAWRDRVSAGTGWSVSRLEITVPVGLGVKH